ncbi:(3R)-3-hydroxyacyl-CoA dehydrogenase isoform X2 [Alligator mississippiensis]|uniref:(3R)-3-hydroxyacyl-CoA dehydrogenase isoform X2 n=1 Tax=Alligator mississippiensis TaxID=8496 RepID=UPI002877EC43|nr:(3R)-3-hydroxyacyl-CoA dehydrogenase isoform X2 [Alligator mississippiensis]
MNELKDPLRLCSQSGAGGRGDLPAAPHASAEDRAASGSQSDPARGAPSRCPALPGPTPPWPPRSASAPPWRSSQGGAAASARRCAPAWPARARAWRWRTGTRRRRRTRRGGCRGPSRARSTRPSASTSPAPAASASSWPRSSSAWWEPRCPDPGIRQARFSAAPHVCVNCAGITRDEFLLKQTEAAFDEVIAVNLKGTFLVMQAVAQALVQSGALGGSIINLGSIVGKVGNLGQVNYVASKAGVEGLTKTAAKELARYGIRCNVVLPGFIRTPMTDQVPPKVMEKRWLTSAPSWPQRRVVTSQGPAWR